LSVGLSVCSGLYTPFLLLSFPFLFANQPKNNALTYNPNQCIHSSLSNDEQKLQNAVFGPQAQPAGQVLKRKNKIKQRHQCTSCVLVMHTVQSMYKKKDSASPSFFSFFFFFCCCFFLFFLRKKPAYSSSSSPSSSPLPNQLTSRQQTAH